MQNEPPELVYHYTTQTGLIGIITSRKLWATDLYYLNDSSELTYAIGVIRNELSQIQNALNPRYSEIVQRIFASLEWLAIATIYVSSFSEDGDLLSQWRAYCTSTSGFSIGFDRSRLWKATDRQNFRLEQCIYDEHTQKQKTAGLAGDLVRSILDELGESATQQLSTMQEIADAKARDFLPKFLEVAPILKAPYFQGEKEWRLISTDTNFRDPKIDFREGRSMIVPYFKFDLTIEQDTLPIKEIIIGPTPHKELSRASVVELIDRNGLIDCEVKHSMIPFRGW